MDCDDAEHHCLQGNIFDSIGRGLDGAELCVDELPDVPCVVTGSDGSFQLPGLATTGQLTLLSDREGYVLLVNPFQAERLPVTWRASYRVTDGVSKVQRDSPEGACDANLQGWDFEVGDPAAAPIQADRSTYFALECP